ncbi:hypothetical protein ASD56_05495 [Microbacterium sp. Root166]|uniref:FHA domain-containing protein n=1 Tax=Microbacterium sp. Root166 TaxID=1736478 RepID=UPI0006FFF672|nr:FHA domain-containing protein [Microbacterium sp. Root166]KQZ85744.1 hypothetical protein ASD56_05495 [Microbacterium sp. Root166]
MSVHYSPGAQPVAVTPEGFVILAEDASPALAVRVHALVAAGRGLGGVLEALTDAYGISLSAVPHFAVALAEGDSVRLAVRGGFALDVEADAPERVSGEGVTTWTERVIAAASQVSFASEDAAPPEFPVTDGVVLAGGLRWIPAQASVAGRAAAPAPGAGRAAAPAGPRRAAPPMEPDPELEPVVEVAEPATPEVAAPVSAAPVSAADLPVAGTPPRAAHVPPPASEAPVVVAAPEPPVVVEPRLAPVSGVTSAGAETISGLIDSDAVLSLGETDSILPVESEATMVPVPEAEPAAEALEVTVIRSREPVTIAMQGDHDGETISLAEARALRTGHSLPPLSTDDSAPAPLAPPRPPAPGRIRVSTGQVLTLDRTVVIGRRPRSTRVSGTDLPHLVAVDSPQQDISRSHVELRVEGDSILATDLHTTNGTTLLRPGVDPVRLHPGETTVVVPGDVIDLGDGITVAIEDLA